MNLNEKDSNTDVVELCALLQCLGFNVRSLDTSDVNLSQEAGVGGYRTVVINCQSSGLHVVLESDTAACSCPVATQESSGVWQVSAISGGRQHDKEFGSSLLGSLPKSFRERLSTELRELVKSIRQQNETETGAKKDTRKQNDKDKDVLPNRSASMIEFKTTPEKSSVIKVDTPTRYRSLGSLNNPKDEFELPAPGVLTKMSAPSDTSDAADELANRLKQMCRRQSTYTVSTPGSTRCRNKTSSPISATANNLLDKLVDAEKTAEELRNKLADLVRDFATDDRNSSMSSLVLDVSKISVLKGTDISKNQFASSPNLSGLGTVREEMTKSKSKRFESVSTSNLSVKKATLKTDGGTKLSKLRKLSPSYFLSKKEPTQKLSLDSKTSKLNNLKAKVVKPIHTMKSNNDSTQNLSSAMKNKYSHIKSTIPRPTPTKKV